jgi:hypothetical protein
VKALSIIRTTFGFGFSLRVAAHSNSIETKAENNILKQNNTLQYKET